MEPWFHLDPREYTLLKGHPCFEGQGESRNATIITADRPLPVSCQQCGSPSWSWSTETVRVVPSPSAQYPDPSVTPGACPEI